MATVEEKKKTVSFNVSGVDPDTKNTINSSYTPSDSVVKSTDSANNYLGKVQQNADKIANNGIVSNDTWKKINSSYKQSNTVKSAMQVTQDLLAKLTTGRTSYSDSVDQMVKDIMNKEDFSYDPATDTLFQQKLAESMRSGKQAMQDTIGQAAQLTGGYGSSYATSAGNQAYNSFIEDAYNDLPEYYQMARDTYQMDMDNAFKKYGMLSAEDNKEFGRTATAWQANNTNWQELYNMEYQQWKDGVSNALSSAGLQINESNAVTNALGDAYNASKGFSDTLYNREYGQYSDEVSRALQVANLENSDYWKRYNASKKGSGSGKKGSENTKELDKYTQQNLLRSSETNPNGFLYDIQNLEAKGYDVSRFSELVKATSKKVQNAPTEDEIRAQNEKAAQKEAEAQKKESDAWSKTVDTKIKAVDQFMKNGDDTETAIAKAMASMTDEEKEKFAEVLYDLGY